MVKTNNSQLRTILEKYQEISTLVEISAILHWDQNTYMPQAAAENRARQTTLIEEMVTNKWNEPELKSLIEGIDDAALNDEEKAMMRNIRRATRYYFNVPKKTILSFAETTTKAFSVWQEARANNDFKAFRPYLTEIVAMKREIAGYLGYKKNPYDALLDLYEPGLTSIECEKVFSYLQPRITSLLKRIVSSKEYRKPISFMKGSHVYDEAHQRELTTFLLNRMTYPGAEGRLDVSAHPFTTTLGAYDVRITTNYHEDDVRSAFASTIHEAGHGLYELGVDRAYDHTPFAGGVSLAVHESQSRFWENQVGRSYEFSKFMKPLLESMFPKAFISTTVDEWVKYVNYVQPGLIRIEADEVTYNLHIILRFEMESALINGTIDVKDVPDAWNQKMEKYLGIIPPNDAKGCLQDVHWSYGDMGYFPTYCLGTLFAAQFTNKMEKDMNLGELIAAGDLAPIRQWLRDKIHIYGSRFMPEEIITKVTGEPLNPKYFIDYLEKKYAQIYKL